MKDRSPRVSPGGNEKPTNELGTLVTRCLRATCTIVTGQASSKLDLALELQATGTAPTRQSLRCITSDHSCWRVTNLVDHLSGDHLSGAPSLFFGGHHRPPPSLLLKQGDVRYVHQFGRWLLFCRLIFNVAHFILSTDSWNIETSRNYYCFLSYPVSIKRPGLRSWILRPS